MKINPFNKPYKPLSTAKTIGLLTLCLVTQCAAKHQKEVTKVVTETVQAAKKSIQSLEKDTLELSKTQK